MRTSPSTADVGLLRAGFCATQSGVNEGRSVGLHPRLLRYGRRVLHPRDAVELDVDPRAEFRRMESTGTLRRIATGYYVVVPQDRIGDLPGDLRPKTSRWVSPSLTMAMKRL